MARNQLLEFPDPFAEINKRLRHLGKPAKEAYPIQPYTDEEEEGILSKAGGATLSALGYIGGVLDKPRRALWGAVGGKPRELLNMVVPFSDALGVTDEKDAISGRDALEAAGILGPNEEGLDLGDVVGFGAEVLGDPLTYVGGLGAVGKLGKVAKKAGAMGDVLSIAAKKLGKAKVGKLEAGMNVTHADLLAHAASDPKKLRALEDAAGGASQLSDLAKLNEPVSGLTTVGLPFMGPGKVIGTGPRAQKVARGLDTAFEAARYSQPGRFAARLFSKPVKQTAEAESQIRAAEGFHAAQAAEAETKTHFANEWQKLLEEGKVHKDDWGTVSDVLGQAIERTTGRDVLGPGRKVVNDAADFLAKNQTPSATIPNDIRSTLVQSGFVENKASTLTPGEQAHQHLQQLVSSAPAAPTRDTVESIIQGRLGAPGALPSGNVPHPEMQRLLIDVAKDARNQLDEIRSARQAIGAGESLVDRVSLYGPRSAAYTDAGAGQGARSMPTGSKHDIGREDYLRNIPRAAKGPGGRGSIDRMVADPQIAGSKAALSPADSAKYIRENYLDVSPADTADLQRLTAAYKGKQITPGGIDYWRMRSLEEAHAQADSLAEWLRTKIPDERVLKGMPQYRDAMADLLTGLVSEKQALAAENSVHDLIVDVADQAAAGPSIKSILGKRRYGGAGLSGVEAYKTFAQRMADRGKLNPSVVQALDDPKLRSQAMKTLQAFRIPDAHAADINRVMDFYKNPDTLKGALHYYDRLTNWLKSHLTVVAPSFFSRNLQTMVWSDMLVNIQNAANPAEWGNLFSNWKMQQQLLAGKTVKGLSNFPAFKGMTDEEATRLVRSAQFGHRVASAKVGAMSDLLGAQGQDLSHFSRDIPGVTPTGPLLEAKRFAADVKHHGKHSLNPFGTRGGYDPFTRKEIPREDFSPFMLANAGERANSFSESLGRGATFLGQLRNGASLETAGNISRAVHVDYGQLTRWEKEFIQRLFPFWAWAKGSVPFTLKQLWERPGGPTAKAIKASNAATESDPFVPEQLRGSASIPIGEGRSPGLKRYLTVDLPHETLNDFFSKRPTTLGTIKSTGMGIASQLNPMLKAPAELITGQSFFQKGRPLTDLYSPTGQGPLVDQLLTNSPTSRYLSMFNQLAQPASRKTATDKAVNLLAGLRLQDIDEGKAKNAAVREFAQEKLRGSNGVKTFQDLYVPKDQLENLDPEQVELLRLLKTQSARSTAKKKEATKGEKAAKKKRKELLAGLGG